MMVGMGDDERFEPTPEQRAWLDALSPERRHEVSDALHAHWHNARGTAEKMDDLVDALLECEPSGAAFDQLTGMALKAEGFRALARCDKQRADELFAAAEQYHVDPSDIRITIERPPDQ